MDHPGYCGGGGRADEAEMTLSSSEQHWGWCDVSCSRRSSFAFSLRLKAVSIYSYTSLSVLPEEECRKFRRRQQQQSSDDEDDRILCAAKKNWVPVPKVFRRVNKGFQQREPVPGND